MYKRDKIDHLQLSYTNIAVSNAIRMFLINNNEWQNMKVNLKVYSPICIGLILHSLRRPCYSHI